MEVIVSKSNGKVSYFRSLRLKKNRESERAFLADGIKLFNEARRNGADIRCAAVSEEYFRAHSEELEGVNCAVLSDRIFSAVTDESAPEGIVTCVGFPEIHSEESPGEDYGSGSSFVCCGVRDPGNLGTIIRTADAFGCGRLVLSADCADVYNPKTVRASMGAIFRQKIIFSPDIVKTIGAMRKRGNVYAAALDRNALSLADITADDSTVFVVGNEGRGLDAEVIKACDRPVFIPMTGEAESLNVSQAAAVLLWETYKNRGK